MNDYIKNYGGAIYSKEYRVEKSEQWPGYEVHVYDKTITDIEYFLAIENQVRTQFADFEVNVLLPKAKSLLKATSVPENALKEYSVEGYYYKSDALRLYFKFIRNFQQNQEVYSEINKLGPREELDALKNVLESDLFGTAPVRRYPWPDAPLKRRWDILTYTMSDTELFDIDTVPRPWDIPMVLAGVRKHFSGRTNLVELAVATNDPILMCASAETNNLGRMYAWVTGSISIFKVITKYEIIWKVNPDVQALGEKLVALYMEKMTGSPYVIVAPTPDNINSLQTNLELPRVSHLGYLTETEKNYFWVVDESARLTDIYTKEFLTTEIMKKKTTGLYDY